MWVVSSEIVGAPAHAFYDRLNEILDQHHFDRNVEHLCRRYYKGPLGWDGKLYQIERQAVTTGLRRADVRVEQRLDGSLAVRHGERYLPVTECVVADRPKAARPAKAAKTPRAGRGSDWNQNFDLKKAPKIWQAAQGSGHRRGEAV